MAKAGTYRIPVGPLVAFWVLVSVPGSAQVKKEVRFTVGQKPVISITNNYGPITVKPSGNNQVVVTMVSYSDGVSFVNEQHGTRIELRAESRRAGRDLAEYSVLAPTASTVILQSLDGALYAQGLRGDAVLEGATATAEVSDAADAHIHIKTLSGSARLTNIRHSRLYVNSVTGNVDVRNVTESQIEAHSASGRITSMHIHSQVLVIRLQLQVQPRESAKALGSSSPGRCKAGRALCSALSGARYSSSGLDWIAD